MNKKITKEKLNFLILNVKKLPKKIKIFASKAKTVLKFIWGKLKGLDTTQKAALFILYTVFVSFSSIGSYNAVQKSIADKKEAQKSETEQSAVYYTNVGGEYAIGDKYTLLIKSFVYDIKITPSSTEYNTYYTNTAEGNIYLDIICDLTNLTGNEISAKDIISAGVGHGNNNYSSVTVVEINDFTGFEYADEYTIKPGEKVRMHFISNVPATVEKDETPVFFNMKINGEDYITELTKQ